MNFKHIIFAIIIIFLLFHFKHYVKISNLNEIIQINNFKGESYTELLREKKPIIIYNITKNTSAFNNLTIEQIKDSDIELIIDANNKMKTTITNINKNDKYQPNIANLNFNDNINESGYKNLLLPLSLITKKTVIYGSTKNPKTITVGVQNEIETLICSDGECIISLYKPAYTNILKNESFTKTYDNLFFKFKDKDNLKTLNISLNLGDALVIPSGWSYNIIYKKPTILYNIKNDSFFFNIFSSLKRLF